MGGVGKEGEAEARFTGGFLGTLLGVGTGMAAHYAGENYFPAIKPKLNRNTKMMTVGVTALVGAYAGMTQLWERFLPVGKQSVPDLPLQQFETNFNG